MRVGKCVYGEYGIDLAPEVVIPNLLYALEPLLSLSLRLFLSADFVLLSDMILALGFLFSLAATSFIIGALGFKLPLLILHLLDLAFQAKDDLLGF